MSSNKKAFWGFSEIWESTHVFFNEGWRVFQVFHSLAEGSRTIRIHLFWDSDWSLNPLFLLILKSSTKRTSRSWRFFLLCEIYSLQLCSAEPNLFKSEFTYLRMIWMTPNWECHQLTLWTKFEVPINWTHHSNWRLWHQLTHQLTHQFTHQWIINAQVSERVFRAVDAAQQAAEELLFETETWRKRKRADLGDGTKTLVIWLYIRGLYNLVTVTSRSE